jgi:hypothetical protein
MGALDIKQLLDIISQAGGVGALVFFIVAASKGWIIFKREFDIEIKRREVVEKERNDWRELALRGTDLADKLASVRERRVFGEIEK